MDSIEFGHFITIRLMEGQGRFKVLTQAEASLMTLQLLPR